MTALALLAVLAANPGPGAGAPGAGQFKEGLEAYDARDFKRALEAFEAAHRLSRKPQILFNIAQTHRVLGDCLRAVSSYEAFIASVPADDPLVPRARALRQELGSCPDRPQAASAAHDDVATPAPAAPDRADAKIDPPLFAVTSPPARVSQPEPAGLRLQASAEDRERAHPGSALRTTCIATAGASVGLGAAGLGFGLWARSVEGSVEGQTTWGAAADREYQRGEALGRAATTLLISAGVTTAVAVTTCLLSRR